MKLESTLEKLSEAISRVQKVSSKNLSLPVLENVLIIAKNNTLTFRSTNLHVGVEYTFDVRVDVEGELAVNLDIFAHIISNLRGEHKIQLETRDGHLHIETEKSSMNVNLQSHDDFPTLPMVENDDLFMVDIDLFVEGVKSVVYSASLSDIKPEISSVYIHSEGNELVFVATDSFRLAEKRMVVEGMEDFPGLIVPVKNIQECIKIFAGISGSAALKMGKNQLSLQNDYLYFTSRVVDGSYPNYQQIIPQEFSLQGTMLKNDLVNSLKLVNIFSDSFNQVECILSKTESKLSIKSRNTNIGENSTDVDVVVEGDGDISMFLNHRYLSDAFPSLESDSISMSFTEKNRPFVLRAIGDKSFLYLIMPMNR